MSQLLIILKVQIFVRIRSNEGLNMMLNKHIGNIVNMMSKIRWSNLNRRRTLELLYIDCCWTTRWSMYREREMSATQQVTTTKYKRTTLATLRERNDYKPRSKQLDDTFDQAHDRWISYLGWRWSSSSSKAKHWHTSMSIGWNCEIDRVKRHQLICQESEDLCWSDRKWWEEGRHNR